MILREFCASGSQQDQQLLELTLGMFFLYKSSKYLKSNRFQRSTLLYLLLKDEFLRCILLFF